MSLYGMWESLIKKIWGYTTRTLTNLDDTRAAKIDHLQADITDTPPSAADYTATRASYLDAAISSRAEPGAFSEVVDTSLAGDASYSIAVNGIFTAVVDSTLVHLEFYCDDISSWIGGAPSDKTITFVAIGSNTRLRNTSTDTYRLVLRRFII